MSFIFDTSKGETPETLKRKRELADMLLGRRRGIATNVGEGLAELGNAIAYRMAAGKADRAAAFGQEQAQKGFAPILAALGGGGASAAPAPSAATTGAAPSPSGGNADAIRQGLIQRGLAPHVADGFIRNFQDESRLDPTINEHSPLVPGSRGGFGLAQWTGPRRRALEQYASSKGVAPGDMGIQLDFLMSELQGPESRAAKAIMAAPDSNSAAVAVLNNFLRPAESHRAKREARYMGQPAAQPPVQAGSPPPAPQQPQQASAVVAPSQGGGIGLPQLLQAAQNPWVAQNPLYSGIINTLIENQLQLGKPLDPMTKLQMEKLAIEIEQARNPQMSPADAARIQLDRDKFNAEQGKPTPLGRDSRLVGPDGKVIVDAMPENKAPTVQKTLLPDGSEMAVQWDGATGQWIPIKAPAGGGTLAPPKPLTEGQSKDVVYSTRAEGAMQTLDQYETALTSGWNTAAGSLPGVGNFLVSPEYQQAKQAGDEFLQAVLRKDTGAAITSDEQALYGGVYLPRPGDSKEVLLQKRESRKRALEAMKAGMPPAAILQQEKALQKSGGGVVIDGYTIEEVR